MSVWSEREWFQEGAWPPEIGCPAWKMGFLLKALCIPDNEKMFLMRQFFALQFWAGIPCADA